jgi:hypothetical protein
MLSQNKKTTFLSNFKRSAGNKDAKSNVAYSALRELTMRYDRTLISLSNSPNHTHHKQQKMSKIILKLFGNQI